MKALVYENSSVKLVNDYAKPVINQEESLVKILIAAICNTDKEIIKGYKPDFSGIIGHEFVGIVEQSSDKSLIGKRVVGELNAGCKECLYCKSGREKHCRSRRSLGIANKDGCFAQYMSIETKLLHVVPDILESEQAIFTEPLAAAIEILEQVHVKPSSNVAIIGDGRLAFMIAQVLSLTGVDLTVIGRHSEKLESFKPYAKVTTNVEDTYEIVVDATGSKTGIITAQKITRAMGTIVIKSTYFGDASINLSSFVVDEIKIVGSRCGPFEPALKLLKKGLINFPKIELYNLEQYEEAFNSKAFKSGFILN